MTRKRITQIFPFLLPLRQKQRKAFFYMGMILDKETYAKTQRKQKLPYEIYSTASKMINENSGFDIQYQKNKVHNLKLAAAKLNRLLIQPGETFSFCLAIRNADKRVPYKDGLSLVNGEICGEYGGGLCQLSNLLYLIFLHSPLTIIERHGHEVEALPPTDNGYIAGIDATIAEGWLDLKVKNNTAHPFQLTIDFDEEYVYGRLLSGQPKGFDYELYNSRLVYVKKGDTIFEESTLCRKQQSCLTGCTTEEILYDNSCIIEYPLPKVVKVMEI